MATIEERKTYDGRTSYRVQIRLKGYPSQTATFARLTDARKWAQQVESSIREGKYFKNAESKKHTFKELIDRYVMGVLPNKKDSRKREGQLMWWKEQLGHYLLSEVTPAIIAEKRDLLLSGVTPRGTKRSPATVVRYLAALSHAFTVGCNEWGWVDDSPLRKVTKPKEPRGRVRFLDTSERECLLRVCQESKNRYLYMVVVLALSTGMRLGEIMQLRWGDVDLEKGRIILHETKNGERRVVPLVSYALQLLRDLMEKRHGDTILLFPSNKRKKSMNLRGAWESAVQKAKLLDFRFHDLRHSCASYLAMSGASLTEISEVLGHKTLQMVKRYSHLSESHTSKVVEKMNDKLFGVIG